MTYQTFKFINVRIGISLFLTGFFGFLVLYFFHEIALTSIRAEDDILQWVLVGGFWLFGFLSYGLWGDRRFEQGLKEFRDAEANEDELATKHRIDRLMQFTYSSCFLPGKGKCLREEVVKEYADYLHSIGKDDNDALRIYLKAYLSDPKDPRFRFPIIAALKRQIQLPSEEIDLLLLMFKAGYVVDKTIASHLAYVFMGKNRFNKKTETVFIAALENNLENSPEIVRFVLPHLLKKNRVDEYAIKFFIKALPHAKYSTERLKLVLGKSFCVGRWESVNPDLHNECKLVFDGLPQEKKDSLTQSINNNRIDQNFKRIKLFGEEDLETLRRLQFKFGIIRSGWEPFQSGVLLTLSLLKRGAKKSLLIGIDWLIAFGRLGLVTKLSVLFVCLLSGGVYYQILTNTNVVQTLKIPKEIGKSSLGVRPKSKDQNSYTLQVAAMKRKKQANRMIAKLKNKGLEGLYIIKTSRRGGGNWYKIRVGDFSNQDKAKELGLKLTNQKLIQNYFIISYRKQKP
jgi:hypothetical protein